MEFHDWIEWSHPDDHPCMGILALVSGTPREARNRTSLFVMQSWVDDTGKADRKGLFTLAGFIAPVKNWAAFSDEWKDVLHLKTPRPIDYFKAYEANRLTEQFFHWKTEDRDKRVEQLARVLIKYVGAGHGIGISVSVPYEHFDEVLASALSQENPNLGPHRNPFYLGFINIVGAILEYALRGSTREQIHLLFDEGIDKKDLLIDGYAGFLDEIKKIRSGLYDLIVNKAPEFRNDKCNPPLQAADLLAWHKRLDLAAKQKGSSYNNPVWKLLNEGIEIQDHHVTRDEMIGIRELVNTLQKKRLEQIAKSPDPEAALKRFKKS